MDDFEIDAFILEQKLRLAQRTYPRSEYRERNLQTMIDTRRDQSRTWRPLNTDHRRPHHDPNPRVPQAVRVIETGQTFSSMNACAKAINGHPGDISKALRGLRISHRGYTFERINSVS